MPEASKPSLSRRSFLKTAAGATAGVATVAGGSYWLGSRNRVSRAAGKKVIVIGIDGFDPGLAETLMNAGRLPNLRRLREQGGFSRLGTSIPPQSPVAWANFINGAGPGSHGIFDFIHRHPHEQIHPFYSASEIAPGEGAWEVGDYRVPLDFWPFNHRQPTPELLRRGVPFWDFLDEAGIPSTFYDLPCNYPPSPSHHGHHRCIAGMGTPDMLGTYGTYQHYSEDGPDEPLEEGGGKRYKLSFEGETARAYLVGPEEPFLRQPEDPGQRQPNPMRIEFLVHRDREVNGAVIDIQERRLILRAGQWSRWIRIEFRPNAPWFLPGKNAVSGICRFYLQEAAPNCRLYVSPINIDPSAPAVQVSEPASFLPDVSSQLGLFYTTGFQEDHKALSNGIFADDEYVRQATIVLEERLALFDYALQHYDDGLLFFYFSSSDLQSHMFWWNSDAQHPTRTAAQARRYFGHIHRLYQRLDQVIGDVLDRYGSQASIFVMSDHGFANFGRQFNLNSWLREQGYLGPQDCTSILRDVDWSQTLAYGLGINGLYVNLKGREHDGIVEPGEQKEELLRELVSALEAVEDVNGEKVIRNAYRTDRVYGRDAPASQLQTGMAPDLIIGYTRGYRASWATCLGDLTEEVLLDNDSAWSADHCADALEVPGAFFSNRPYRNRTPSLIDVAPSILAEFGLSTPATMVGRSVF